MASQSLDDSPDSAPLPGAPPEVAAAAPAGRPAPPPSFVPLPADFASRPPPGPVDLSYPLPEPGRAAAPPRATGPAALPGAAPGLDHGALAALLSGVAQAATRASRPPPLPQAGLLPAGQVTLPLAEVMRLVGGGGPRLATRRLPHRRPAGGPALASTGEATMPPIRVAASLEGAGRSTPAAPAGTAPSIPPLAHPLEPVTP